MPTYSQIAAEVLAVGFLRFFAFNADARLASQARATRPARWLRVTRPFAISTSHTLSVDANITRRALDAPAVIKARVPVLAHRALASLSSLSVWAQLASDTACVRRFAVRAGVAFHTVRAVMPRTQDHTRRAVCRGQLRGHLFAPRTRSAPHAVRTEAAIRARFASIL